MSVCIIRACTVMPKPWGTHLGLITELCHLHAWLLPSSGCTTQSPGLTFSSLHGWEEGSPEMSASIIYTQSLNLFP